MRSVQVSLLPLWTVRALSMTLPGPGSLSGLLYPAADLGSDSSKARAYLGEEVQEADWTAAASAPG